MPAAIPVEAIALNRRAALFAGRDHGAGVSFFVVRFAPGEGPSLHRHPYDETFLVLDGTARVTVADETIEIHAGEILVAPAGAPHAFTCTGDVELHLIAMSPHDHVVQESLS